MSPIHSPDLVPELDVADLDTSLEFYVGLLGFELAAERPEERFAYLIRGGVHLMLEEADGPGRRFRTAPLERPYGRGLNLQMRLVGVTDLYRRLEGSGWPLLIALEERWYRQGSAEKGLRQFVIPDPDGYLLRFVEEVGARPVSECR